jgi:hypothetical protein
MTNSTPTAPARSRPDRFDQPVGTWVIGGFLLFVSLMIWGPVALIFMQRA